MHFTRNKYFIESGGRNLDTYKVENYINEFDKDEKDFVATILDNTKYITFNEVLGNLKIAIKEFAREIKNNPFYIFADIDKIGSDLWLTNMLEDDIKKLNFQGFISTEEFGIKFRKFDVNTLLVIDDHICSGIHLVSALDNATYDSKINGINIFVVVGYAAKDGIRLMEEIGQQINCNVVLYFVEEIKQLSDYYGEEFVWEVLGRDEDSILRKLGSEGNPCLVYFDYTIGKSQSSFPGIYKEGSVPHKSKKLGSLLIKDIDRSGINVFAKEILK